MKRRTDWQRSARAMLGRASVRLLSFAAPLALVSSAQAAPARAAVQETPGDLAVAIAVEEELFFDTSVPSTTIHAAAAGGVVTLTGEADNLLAKRRAARLAETVRGVRAVVNRIEVAPAPRRADGALRADVLTALGEDPAVDSGDVDVRVEGGEVRLSGKIRSWSAKRLCETVAMGVRGVVALENALEVDLTVERPDEEIRAEIEGLLLWNTLVDHALIDVEVDDGSVVLQGVVGSAAESRKVRRLAWIAGVRYVDTTDLKVERWARDPDLKRDKYAWKPDGEVRAAVLAALSQDPRVAAFRIEVHVDEGDVTLRGTVDNLKAKRAAVQDARDTVGVIGVNDRLRVRPTTHLQDADLREIVQRALGRDPFVADYAIEVTVRGGVVYLDGVVDTLFQRAQADDVAAHVGGVEDVINTIEARRTHSLVFDPYVDTWNPYGFDWYRHSPPRVSLDDDGTIRRSIERRLWWSPFVDSDALTVVVEDGVATLSGEVTSPTERRAARELAIEGGAV